MNNLIKKDCSISVPFVGAGECDPSSLGLPIGVEIWKQGFTLDMNSATFVTDYKNAIKKGLILPLGRFNSNETANEENVINTSDYGVDTLVRLGLPKNNFTFTEGYCFHKQVFTFNENSKNWAIVYVFENGIFGKVENDTFSGFNLSNISVSTLNLASGSDIQKTMISCQIESANEYNLLGGMINYANLSSSIKLLNGIIGVGLVFSKVGADYFVEATTSCTGQPVSGLATATKWQVLGANISLDTIVEQSPGKYLITFDGAGGGSTCKIKLADVDYQSVELLGSYYGGISNGIVVA